MKMYLYLTKNIINFQIYLFIKMCSLVEFNLFVRTNKLKK